MDLPSTLPTTAVLATLDHVISHGHETPEGGTMPARDHFLAVLREELGLQERNSAPS